MPRPPTSPDGLSLEQIEGHRWGDAPAGAPRLAATVHRLRRIPIRDLSAEDHRILLGQHIGLPTLLPRVLTRLETDPLWEGDHYYPGDVLAAALRVPAAYWRKHPDQAARMVRVIGLLADRADQADEVDRADDDLLADARAWIEANTSPS